jgi:hypothetical protein
LRRAHLIGVIAGLVLLVAQPAGATFHLWTIEEAFTNEDGTIQYVEFRTTSDFQNLMSGHVLQAQLGATVLHAFTFPSNLPSTATANHFFLVATPAFATVTGVAPDYVLPPTRFLERATNTLTLVAAVTPAFVFAPGTLPTDGIHSLTSVAGMVQVTVATPTNFANQTAVMQPECSDGVDNDGDGLTDYPTDLGCRSASGTIESPACQDGVDNDLDGKIDFDGGASANHGVPLAPADPQCGAPYHNNEKPTSCGLGAELLLPLLALRFLARRRRAAAAHA